MAAGPSTFARQESADFSAAALSPPAWDVRKPVLAALNGHAIGLGLSLALQCDIRIAARDARYGIVQVRRGVMPDAYSHWTLPRLVGLEKAALLLLTGTRITGAEAAEMGLVSRALPAAEVLPAALALAREVAANTAPLSVAICKRLLWDGANLTRAQVERRETALHHHLMGRPDSVEGVMAYLERRPPRFSSRVSRDWPDWPEDPG
jgi:enoyl-CoA hydratase/carnithine racemase